MITTVPAVRNTAAALRAGWEQVGKLPLFNQTRYRLMNGIRRM
jgi:hypothetical protein